MKLTELRALIRDILIFERYEDMTDAEIDELAAQAFSSEALFLETPEEDLLKRWGEKSEDPVDVALTKLGILPVHQGHWSSSTVGQGTANTVKEVIYKGRRAVARYSIERRELEAMVSFVDLQDRMAPDYTKHFPEILTVFEFETANEFSNYPMMTFYGAVVEMLDRLPPTLANELNGISPGAGVTTARIDLLLDDETIIASLIKRAVDIFHGDRSRLQMAFDTVIVPILHRAGEKRMPLYMVRDKLNHAMIPFQNSGQSLSDDVMSLLRTDVIPMSTHRRSLADKHPSAKVKEFAKFLAAFKELSTWDDLHPGNFMIRRSTGDIVVVDPGLFGQ